MGARFYLAEISKVLQRDDERAGGRDSMYGRSLLDVATRHIIFFIALRKKKNNAPSRVYRVPSLLLSLLLFFFSAFPPFIFY